MLDLNQYTCLGAALRDALDRFPSEVCLIEADRDREKVRLTYSDFKEIALPHLARRLSRGLGPLMPPADKVRNIRQRRSK